MASACFLGCRSPNGEEDEAEEKCDNCDIIACSKECMKLHKPTDHPSMLSLVQKVYEVVNLVSILVLHQLHPMNTSRRNLEKKNECIHITTVESTKKTVPINNEFLKASFIT